MLAWQHTTRAKEVMVSARGALVTLGLGSDEPHQTQGRGLLFLALKSVALRMCETSAKHWKTQLLPGRNRTRVTVHVWKLFTVHSHSTLSHVPVVPPVLSLTSFPFSFWSHRGDQLACCSQCLAVSFDRCDRFLAKGKRDSHYGCGASRSLKIV